MPTSAGADAPEPGPRETRGDIRTDPAAVNRFRISFFRESFQMHAVIHIMSAFGITIASPDFGATTAACCAWVRAALRILVHLRIADLQDAHDKGVACWIITSTSLVVFFYLDFKERFPGALSMEAAHLSIIAVAYALSGVAVATYAMSPRLEFFAVIFASAHLCRILLTVLEFDVYVVAWNFVSFFLGFGMGKMHVSGRWEQYLRQSNLQIRSQELIAEKQKLDAEREHLCRRAERLERMIGERSGSASRGGGGSVVPSRVSSSRDGGRGGGRADGPADAPTLRGLRSRRSPARGAAGGAAGGAASQDGDRRSTRSRPTNFTSVSGDSGSSVGFEDDKNDWDDNDSQIMMPR